MTIPSDSPRNFIVYMITNTLDGKRYIGQSSQTMKRRWAHHFSNAKTMDTYLYRAMRKHGVGNFSYRVLFSGTDKSVIDLKERAYIKLYGTNDCDKGYNQTKGGEGILGWTHSPETRRKIAIASTGNTNFKGKKHTAATIEKMKAARTKPELLEQSRQQAFRLCKLNMGRKRPPFTEETLAKMSIAQKSRKHNPPTELAHRNMCIAQQLRRAKEHDDSL